jgi:hypothetical protein
VGEKTADVPVMHGNDKKRRGCEEADLVRSQTVGLDNQRHQREQSHG